MVKLETTPNKAYKASGPASYALAAKKYKIQASSPATVFFEYEGELLRFVGKSTTTTAAPETPAPEQEKKKGGFLSFLKKKNKGDKKSKHHGKTNGGNGGSTKTTPTPIAGNETAKVPADDVQNDSEYNVPVLIGTPGVTLNLDFDTGSSDLWVWSSLLKGVTTAQKQGHTLYDPSKSSTAKVQSGESWQISYGDGSSASGSVYKDTVTLQGAGDSTNSGVVVKGQAVETATKLSSAFLSGPSDGLLGLAFPSINTVTPTQAATPVENMISQSLIPQPLFTAKLDKGDSNGFYTFGYIDDTVELTGDIAYTAIDSSNGFWEFPSPSIKIGSNTVQRTSGNTAIADTGTTLILLDDSTVQAIYAAIPGATLNQQAGGYVIPSSVDASTLPALSFAVGSEGQYYSIAPDDLLFADNGDGTYFGAVQSKGQIGQDILGDVFLKRVYAVFNQTSGAPQIGFGQRSLTTPA